MWATRRVRIEPAPWEGLASTEVFVRDAGDGTPLVFLHGGWGYEAFPFDAVGHALLREGFRCLVPDRTGYGRSTPLRHQPLDFHRRAARETLALLDALDVPEAVLWGHSDGAVIAAWLAIEAPARFPALVLESLHAWPLKPRSRAFFESAAAGQARLSPRTVAALERDHGARWGEVVRMNGQVWVDLAAAAQGPRDDLYGGALARLRSACLLLHGRDDPRTEPGEIEWVDSVLARSEHVTVAARHAPHSEAAGWAEAHDAVVRFLLRAARPA